MNEIITDEKDMNDKIFENYFKYQNPSVLAKDQIRAVLLKNQQLVSDVNDGLIHLRNAIIRQEILEIKQLILLKKILDFNKKGKGEGRTSELTKRIKILIPKELLQRLPLALAQAKADSTSEHLLNEIRQLCLFLYQEKEATKKYTTT